MNETPSRDLVIETAPDGSLVRWGLRTAIRGPKAHVVRWASGGGGEVALGRHGVNQVQVVDPDGLTALASVRPDYVAELVANDPAAVFVRAIYDLARPVSAKEIKTHVRKHLGLRHPELDVDKAWTRLRSKVLAVEGIRCPKSGENVNKFSASHLLTLEPALDLNSLLIDEVPVADGDDTSSAPDSVAEPAETTALPVAFEPADFRGAPAIVATAPEAGSSRAVRAPWTLSPAGIDDWLTETSAALANAPGTSETASTVACWFASTAGESADISVAAATALLGLSRRLASDDQGETALRALVVALEADPGALNRDPQLADIACEAAAALPFTAAREALITVLARCAPDIASSAGWWSGADACAVARLLDGRLPRAVVDAIRKAVIAPAAEAAARRATTRADLTRLLDAPDEFLTALQPGRLGSALRRIASSDAVASMLLAEVDNHEALTAERSRIERLEEAAVEAQQRCSDLESMLEDAERRASVLLERAAQTRAEKRERRATAETGIRQELALMTAEFLAFLDSEIGVASEDAIRARMGTLAAKQFLEPIGRVGEITAFEPERHKLMGGAAASGEPVIVRRCGYTWVAGEVPAVALQALVEAHRDM